MYQLIFGVSIIVISIIVLCMLARCKGPWTPTDDHYRQGS
jgi:hypothetical protein